MNETLRSIAEMLGCEQSTTRGYDPAANGAIERFNGTIKRLVEKQISNDDEWDEILPFATYTYNTMPHGSTKFSPFHLFFGREPTQPTVPAVDRNEYPWTTIDADHYLQFFKEQWAVVQAEAKANNAEAAVVMKKNHDASVKRPESFQMGDRVMITPVGKATRNYGPFEIIGISEAGTSAHLLPCHEDYGKPGQEKQRGRRNNPMEIRVPMERLVKLKPGENLKKPHYPRMKQIAEDLDL